MFVGSLELEISIPESRSLKDKRRVVRSFKDRVCARFRVAVAEVGLLDDVRAARMGVATVSGTRVQCEKVLRTVQSHAEGVMLLSIRYAHMEIW